MSIPTNEQRAQWAREAVDVFGLRTFAGCTFTDTLPEQPNEGDDPYCMVKDLMTNLMHLASQCGWDAHEVINNAMCCFEEEEANPYEG